MTAWERDYVLIQLFTLHIQITHRVNNFYKNMTAPDIHIYISNLVTKIATENQYYHGNINQTMSVYKMGFLYYLHGDGFSTCRVSVVKNIGVGPGPAGPVLAGLLFW